MAGFHFTHSFLTLLQVNFTLISISSLKEKYKGVEKRGSLGAISIYLKAAKPCDCVITGDISLPPVAASNLPLYGQILISISTKDLLEEIILNTCLPSFCLFQYTLCPHPYFPQPCLSHTSSTNKNITLSRGPTFKRQVPQKVCMYPQPLYPGHNPESILIII